MHHLCQWGELDLRIRGLRDALKNRTRLTTAISPFVALKLDTTLAEQQWRAREWASGKVPASAHGPRFSFEPRAAARRRLRVGYLSGDFHEHATAYLMAGLFEAHTQHNSEFIEFIGYSFGPDKDSPMRRRLRSAFTRFEDIRPLSDRAAAEKIHADGIDILVDLKGYTADARTAILALRPAPVQVQYLGYPGTMGAPWIDYLIADRFVVPEEHFPFYDEKIIHLPGCYQPNDSQRAIGPTPSRTEAGLPEKGTVFCCFNQAYKITPAIFDIWMRLLQAAPSSVLWLLESTPSAAGNLCQEARARGVDAERLVFAP
jgi:protein O-GlcNAc transferase